MTSPTRSVIVRLAMEPTSYIAGASRAAAATTALDREVAKVGTTSAASMDRAAASAARAEGAFGKASKTAGVFGLRLGELATAGGLVAAALSVKSAADFQQSLTKLATTAGESSKNLGMVGNGLLDMAGKVGISANELAKGMYTVESGGFHGAAGLKVMSAAAQGAVQEQADLSKVTDAVTTILHDYHLSANDAAKVTSQLVTAVSHGKTTFDELTGSLHSVTPLAAKMGISLADITGTLSAMTASGESADQATQNMANTLQHLASPTGTMINELAQLGISTNDLATSLSTKGLAGTLQMVEEAIVNHLDPATKRVLLPALNQSKTAAQDLQVMLGQMPPSLRKLSQSFLDGKTALSDYRKDVRDLGGQQAAMGSQFMSLVTSSQGFNAEIKAGRPAAQVFTAAMQKAFGTTAALNVALQTTGENAAATNAAIKDIAGASAQADGNIKGWSEVQGNFNQQMHEAGAEAGALAIQFGQHLLPVLTSGFGYVNRDVLPAIEHMGSALGDAAHWFGQLPAPIKDVSLALAGLGLAKMIGLTGAFGAAAARVAIPLRAIGDAMYFAEPHAGRFSAQMEVQQKLFQMEQREAQLAAAGISELDGAFASAAVAADGYATSLTAVQKMQMGWDTTLAESMVVEDAQVATLGRMSAATAAAGITAGRAAAGGMATLGRAGSGLLALFGGGWGAALIGAGAAVYGISKSFEMERQRVEDATKAILAWKKAQDTGGQGAEEATQKLDAYQRKIDDAQRALREAEKAEQGAQGGVEGYAQGVAIASNNLDDQKKALDNANKAYQKYRDGLTVLQLAQIDAKKAQNNLNDAYQRYGANSTQVRAAAAVYADAENNVAQAQTDSNNATKTALQLLQQKANLQLGAINSALGAQQAQLSFNDALAQYNADQKLATKNTDEGKAAAARLAEEQNGLSQSAISAAQAAGQQAADQAKANGVNDTANVTNQAMLTSLQNVAKQMGSDTPAAIRQAIASLSAATVNSDSLKGAISKMGLTTVTESGRFRKEFGDNAVVLKGVTDSQVKDLQGLGYTVEHLPNHQVVVSADTQKARDALTQLTKDYHNYAINLGVGGIGAVAARAAGGPIVGPGSGTSDSIPVMASNGEHMLTAAEVQAAGGHGAVFALRSAILGGALKRAAGGPVTLDDLFLTAKVGISPGSLAAAKQALTSLSFAPGAPGNVNANAAIARQMAAQYYGWTGAQWNALYALGQRESGWNNTAQNPTSTAYGIPQFLNSTWATVGLSKTSNPYVQIAGMDKYIANRYGTPINAWAHETRYGWYRDGTDYVPFDMPAMLHKGEAVVPATENARVRSREVSGGSYGGRGAAVTDARSYPVTVYANDGNADTIVRKLQQAQYRNEFLNG